MTSRRQRKRYRRGTLTGDRRGDRKPPSPPKLLGGWGQATPTELWLLYQALREGWQTDPANLARIGEEIAAALEASTPDPEDQAAIRLDLARCRAWIAIEKRLTHLPPPAQPAATKT